MAEQIVLRAEFRDQLGKSASRRMRRHSDKVPGILYGGGVDPVPLSLTYRDLSKAMQEEAFFSQILELSVDDKSQACVLRDLQRHPASDRVQHIDFLRIQEDMAVHMHVPLHYVNEDRCVGVKLGGGRIAHNLIEVEVSCLPRDLPEFIEVDIAELDVGESIHLSDLDLPKGVSIVALGLGQDHDIPVVSVAARRGGADEPIDGEDADSVEDAADDTSEEDAG